MHDSLFTYIEKKSSLSLTNMEKELLREAFIPMHIKKNQYLLQQGQVCRQFAFIVKGAMRQYRIDSKGKEHIVQLLVEDWWCGDRESFIMLTHSSYTIDAWEDTQYLTLTMADTLVLSKKIPAILVMQRKLDDNHSIALQKRVDAALSLSAEERFLEFSNHYPELVQRFPQHIVASYLGITKETLSRVRTQKLKK